MVSGVFRVRKSDVALLMVNRCMHYDIVGFWFNFSSYAHRIVHQCDVREAWSLRITSALL